MIQRGYRVLTLWIVWSLTSLMIYLGLYNDTDVWQFVQHDPSRITWVIIGLFLVGILTSFVLTLVLTVESIDADRLTLIAQKKGWNGIEETSTRLSIARYLNSLRTIINGNGSVDITALIDVEFAIYHRIAHALEIIGNLLITLGLIGTVVGLTLTLTGLTSSLEALGQDQDQLLSGLRGAMGGMGTAFYTTLLGSVLGGVLLRVFSHINQTGVDSLEDVLARICLVYCSEQLKPTAHKDIKALSHEIEILDRVVQQLSRTLTSSGSAIADFKDEIGTLHNEQQQAQLRETIRLQREQLQQMEKLLRMQRGLRPRWLSRLLGRSD